MEKGMTEIGVIVKTSTSEKSDFKTRNRSSHALKSAGMQRLSSCADRLNSFLRMVVQIIQ